MFHLESGRLSVVALFLLSLVFVGCTSHTSVASPVAPSGAITMQPPVRAIIYFQQATLDSKQLTAAIADVCRWQSVFIRAYSAEALIYEISLSQQQTFAMFEKALMRQATQLGVKQV